MANNIMEFFGALKKTDWDEKAEDMKNLRNPINKRLQNRIKLVFE